MNNTPNFVKRMEAARRLGVSGAQAHRAFMRALNKALVPHKLTATQFFVIHQVHTSGPMSQADVADFLCVESQTLVRLLDDMEKQGWVKRVPDSSDRRVKRVHLAVTDQRIQAVLDVFNSMKAEALASFSDEELEIYMRLQTKFAEGLAASQLQQ